MTFVVTGPELGRSLTLLGVLLALALPACSTTREDVARERLSAHPLKAGAGRHESGETQRGAAFDRGLGGYLAHAVRENPELHASFERWRASVHRVARQRRLPEPTLSFAYFVRSVETRVGPQLARVSLQQTFPWPSKLAAGADAAAARAQALERRFDVQALAVSQRVADGYWTLWQIRQTRTIHREHLEVLRGLAETVRARVATGSATLAELQQVDLAASRLEDTLSGMDEAERAAAARLRASIGAPIDAEVPTPGEPPEAALPAASDEELRQATANHPLIASYAYLAEANEASAEQEEAEAYPSFTLGADWIITDESPMPNVAENGKDAVIVGVTARIPLWQGSYDESAVAARAEANAERAEGRAARERALAELEAALSAVRDAARRVALYRDTLVPQAESAYASVLGAYATGRTNVAAMLLSQRDLLELKIELESARADHARSWARLEQVVGRELPRRASVESSPATTASPPARGATPAADQGHAPLPEPSLTAEPEGVEP